MPEDNEEDEDLMRIKMNSSGESMFKDNTLPSDHTKNKTQIMVPENLHMDMMGDLAFLNEQDEDYAVLMMEHSRRMVSAPDKPYKEIKVTFRVPEDAFEEKKTVEDLEDSIPDYMGTLFIPRNILSSKAKAMVEKKEEDKEDE